MKRITCNTMLLISLFLIKNIAALSKCACQIKFKGVLKMWMWVVVVCYVELLHLSELQMSYNFSSTCKIPIIQCDYMKTTLVPLCCKKIFKSFTTDLFVSG